MTNKIIVEVTNRKRQITEHATQISEHAAVIERVKKKQREADIDAADAELKVEKLWEELKDFRNDCGLPYNGFFGAALNFSLVSLASNWLMVRWLFQNSSVGPAIVEPDAQILFHFLKPCCYLV